MNNERAKTIPMHIIVANYDRRGYFERVSYHGQFVQSYREAWERTEAELAAHCMPPRYSSYESFIRGRAHYLRGILGEKNVILYAKTT